ncbi:MAG: hypothetical protein KIT17_01175 [Rubrivivax sp.]|nr:hypothetical protein [Rubrivivax sp.]
MNQFASPPEAFIPDVDAVSVAPACTGPWPAGPQGIGLPVQPPAAPLAGLDEREGLLSLAQPPDGKCSPMTFESSLLWNDTQAGLRVRLHLDERACSRLQVLWLACQRAKADEISDWTVGITCQIEADPGDELLEPAALAALTALTAPRVVAVSATVYADGEVSFELVVDGAEQALGLRESLHLSSLATADTTLMPNS